jgi:D-aminopeptidase
LAPAATNSKLPWIRSAQVRLTNGSEAASSRSTPARSVALTGKLQSAVNGTTVAYGVVASGGTSLVLPSAAVR